MKAGTRHGIITEAPRARRGTSELVRLTIKIENHEVARLSTSKEASLLAGGFLAQVRDSLTAAGEGPTAVGEGPAPVGEGPTAVGEGPTAVGEGPTTAWKALETINNHEFKNTKS